MSQFNPPPIGPDWTQWARQLNAALRRFWPNLQFKNTNDTAAENGILLWDEANGYPVVSKDGVWRQIVLADGYAVLSQDADITAAAINTAYAIEWDAPSIASGITLAGSPTTQVTFTEAGQYMLAFSAQIYSTSASAVTFKFWPRVNGSDVAGSTMANTLHSNGSTIVVSRTSIFPVSAGDYLEAMWSVDSTSGSLKAIAAASPAPATPSVTLSITRIRQ
jgi:hypothetical protein